VFADGRHDMIARSEQSVDSQIECLGPIGGESKLLGIGNAEQPCTGRASVGYDTLRLLRMPVSGPAGRGADLTLAVIDRLIDGLRFGPTCGGVVEINALVDTHPPI